MNISISKSSKQGKSNQPQLQKTIFNNRQQQQSFYQRKIKNLTKRRSLLLQYDNQYQNNENINNLNLLDKKGLNKRFSTFSIIERQSKQKYQQSNKYQQNIHSKQINQTTITHNQPQQPQQRTHLDNNIKYNNQISNQPTNYHQQSTPFSSIQHHVQYCHSKINKINQFISLLQATLINQNNNQQNLQQVYRQQKSMSMSKLMKLKRLLRIVEKFSILSGDDNNQQQNQRYNFYDIMRLNLPINKFNKFNQININKRSNIITLSLQSKLYDININTKLRKQKLTQNNQCLLSQKSNNEEYKQHQFQRNNKQSLFQQNLHLPTQSLELFDNQQTNSHSLQTTPIPIHQPSSTSNQTTHPNIKRKLFLQQNQLNHSSKQLNHHHFHQNTNHSNNNNSINLTHDEQDIIKHSQQKKKLVESVGLDNSLSFNTNSKALGLESIVKSKKGQSIVEKENDKQMNSQQYQSGCKQYQSGCKKCANAIGISIKSLNLTIHSLNMFYNIMQTICKFVKQMEKVQEKLNKNYDSNKLSQSLASSLTLKQKKNELGLKQRQRQQNGYNNNCMMVNDSNRPIKNNQNQIVNNQMNTSKSYKLNKIKPQNYYSKTNHQNPNSNPSSNNHNLNITKNTYHKLITQFKSYFKFINFININNQNNQNLSLGQQNINCNNKTDHNKPDHYLIMMGQQKLNNINNINYNIQQKLKEIKKQIKQIYVHDKENKNDHKNENRNYNRPSQSQSNQKQKQQQQQQSSQSQQKLQINYIRIKQIFRFMEKMYQGQILII